MEKEGTISRKNTGKGGQVGEQMKDTLGFSPLEEGMATHSSVLAWRAPWTKEPGGLQSLGLQRVRQD